MVTRGETEKCLDCNILVTVDAEGNPDDDLHVEVAAKVILDLGEAEVGVAVGVEQAFLRRQQSTCQFAHNDE